MIQKKVVICGSVDDGKSTLTGRIYYDTKNLPEDQLRRIQLISKKKNQKGIGNNLDLTFFNDGLTDEIEQGITIDVSHKFLNAAKERYIFHDSPGHNQYTRNVINAASECNIAIVLVDLTKGILEQTKTHIQILKFLGLKNIIFVLNKIDLINYDKKKYIKVLKTLKNYLASYSLGKFYFIPTSALTGTNVVFSAPKNKWYYHKSIFQILKNIKIKENKNTFGYLSVQQICRKNGKRYYNGQINGNLKKINEVFLLSLNKKIKILNIYNNFKKNFFLQDGAYASIELKGHYDISRGDILCWKNREHIFTGNNFNATLVVTSDEGVYAGREYFLRINNQETSISVNKVKGILDFDENLIKRPKLQVNEIGQVEFSSIKPIFFSESKKISKLSNFIIIDKSSNNIVAGGKINFKLRRSEKIFPTKSNIIKSTRSKIKKQIPICIWLTGRSGSGKTTVAQAIEKKLVAKGKHTYLLDGDNLRSGINKDLGFTKSDRIENIRRVSEVAKLFVDAGLIVIVSLISPFLRDREFAKNLFLKNEFFEIHVNTPLSVCIKRDPKKLYKESKKNFNVNNIGLTGIYEDPKDPFLRVNTEKNNADFQAEKILKKIFNQF
ncbi:adenylyl-sulfate kinase [Pelagibacteraceae bacterium]|nr:adenylyl-sulfate kinase [Pelagibacteraceae bacterium]